MEYKIDKLLSEWQALPSEPNWANLQEKFRAKYREFQEFTSSNKDSHQEIEEMDNAMVELFNKLHDCVIPDDDETNVETQHAASIPPETEPEIETNEIIAPTTEQETEDMKTKKIDENEGAAIENNENTEVSSNEPAPVFDQTEETEQQVVEPVVETQHAASASNQITETNPYQQFEQWATTQEHVSASDLRKYNIPEGIWKENKEQFTTGNLTFRKTVSTLIFNRWEVVKNI